MKKYDEKSKVEYTKAPIDCLQCKIIGVVTFSGISMYAANLRRFTPRHDKGQRLFLASLIVGAGAVAVWRALT
jgi:hypothetical protein